VKLRNENPKRRPMFTPILTFLYSSTKDHRLNYLFNVKRIVKERDPQISVTIVYVCVFENQFL
jgi:hypothetical protein